MPIINDELELRDIKHGVVSVLIENPITEPHLRRWYELSDYSRISPSEHQPPKSDARMGETVLARLLESLARHEYEHYDRINFMIFGVALVIQRYLILENMGIRRRRDLIGQINGMKKLLLQDDSKASKTIGEIKSKIRRAIRNKTDALSDERKKSSDPWSKEPLNATIYEIVEILQDGLSLTRKKTNLLPVVLDLFAGFKMMKKDLSFEAVRSRYNRFQKRHSPYSSIAMDLYLTLVSKLCQ